MDATHYNGTPMGKRGSVEHSEPARYTCRECGWTGRGALTARDHREATGHVATDVAYHVSNEYRRYAAFLQKGSAS